MTTSFEHPRSAFGEFPDHSQYCADTPLGGLDELVAYCTVQVGYYPTQSVCFVAMQPGPMGTAALGPVARMDAGLLMKSDPFIVDGWMESLRGQFTSFGFPAVAMVLFGGKQPGESFRRTPSVGSTYGQIRESTETARVMGLLGAWDPDVTAFLVVGSDGWGHYKCRYAGCCPPKGRPLERLQATQVMADAVLSGRVVAGSREELRAGRCTNPECRAAVERVMKKLEREAHVDQVTRSCDYWTSALRMLTAEGGDGHNGDGEDSCDAEQVGKLAHAILNSRVRDAVVSYAMSEAADCRDGKSALSGDGVLEFMDAKAAESALTAHDMPGERVSACATLLSQIAAHAPEGAQVQALAALGYVRWWQGYGAHAKVAIEDALDLDPTHTLANLVNGILYSWTPPMWALNGGH